MDDKNQIETPAEEVEIGCEAMYSAVIRCAECGLAFDRTPESYDIIIHPPSRDCPHQGKRFRRPTIHLQEVEP